MNKAVTIKTYNSIATLAILFVLQLILGCNSNSFSEAKALVAQLNALSDSLYNGQQAYDQGATSILRYQFKIAETNKKFYDSDFLHVKALSRPGATSTDWTEKRDVLIDLSGPLYAKHQRNDEGDHLTILYDPTTRVSRSRKPWDTADPQSKENYRIIKGVMTCGPWQFEGSDAIVAQMSQLLIAIQSSYDPSDALDERSADEWLKNRSILLKRNGGFDELEEIDR